MKKILRTVSFVCLFSLCLSLFASAAWSNVPVADINKANNNRMHTRWSPTLVDVKYDASGSAFRTIAYFKFTSSNVNQCQKDGFYFTWEHKNTMDNGNISFNNMYTNVPYASFDLDDDGELYNKGNGKYEEAEVTCASLGNAFNHNATYFFDTKWTGNAGLTMNTTMRAQRSLYSGITREYEAHSTESYLGTGNFKIYN